MCCVPQNRLNEKKKNKSAVAIALLVCFIAVSLLSEVFILTHANHAHDHDGVGVTCATCAKMQNAENVLKQLSAAANGASFLLVGLLSAFAIIRAIYSHIAISTPISLKIRMNN